MDKETKNKIKETILKLRELLEEDLEIELKRYGIFVDKPPIPSYELSHLKREDLSKKEVMEKSIDKEIQRGLNRSEATKYFIKEMAFTYLNKLIGLKCMASRGLIREVITQRPEYGNRSLRHKEFLEQNPELRKEPDEGLRKLLRQVFAKITEEIKVLFDPESEYSQVFPSITTLKETIELINENIPREAWKEDELLGWVYQYFHDKEKVEFKKRQKEKKAKAETDDIPIISCIYTPRWIVEYLVNNSLGALWAEMNPNTKLIDELNLVFSKTYKLGEREKKPVQEIKLIDPACGSGHFLLYAFDVFYKMYLEEGVVSEDEIPSSILSNNLYGIDIDLRSVQIAALALYMKAKNYNPDFKVRRINLVCADAVLLNGGKLEELLDEFKDDQEIQNVVQTIWGGLANVKELGTLLKTERRLDSLIEDLQRNEEASLFEKPAEAWSKWRKKIFNTLKRYYEDACESFDVSRQMFANEAVKGLSLLDLFEDKYDVVATNPPYLDKRDYNARLSGLLKEFYKDSSGNLYAAFIERCGDFLLDRGKLAMITPQTYMFLTTYEKLRKYLLSNFGIEKFVHLGFEAFETATVDTSMFVTEKSKPEADEFVGLYYRLIKEGNKEKDLKEAIREGEASRKVFAVPQKNLKIIDGWPFVYWAGEKINRVFLTAEPLREYAEPRQGLATADNNRFLRFFWEVSSDRGPKWFSYMKGGDFSRWYGNRDYVVNWHNDGKEIKNFKDYNGQILSRPQNQQYYFKEGLTWSSLSSKGFSIRHMPMGSIFDAKGPGLFVKKNISLLYLLGFLNSKLASGLLAVIQPTIDFHEGYVAKVPLVLLEEKTIEELARVCVDIKIKLLCSILTGPDFTQTAIEFGKEKGPATLKDSYRSFLSYKEPLIINLCTYQGLIDKEVFKLYEIDGEDLMQILEEQGIPPAWYPILGSYAEIPEDMLPEAKEFLLSGREQMLKDFKIEGFIPEKPSLPLGKLKERFKKLYLGEEKPDVKQATEDYIEDIAIDLGINPVSVLALRKEMDLVNSSDYKHEVENFLTYHLIEELKEDLDGIMPVASIPGHEAALDHLRKRIEMVFGEDKAYDIEQEMKEPLGKSLENWLQKDFFAKHIKQYKKRPIVWQIESPHGTFKAIVYYHKLTADTLKKLKTVYLWKLRDTLAYRLDENRKQLTKSSGG